MFSILLGVLTRYEVIYMYVSCIVGVFTPHEVIYMYVLFIVAGV